MALTTIQSGIPATIRSLLDALPLQSIIGNNPLLRRNSRRGTPGSSLGNNGAHETGRFSDMVDDEEGVGLVGGSLSMDDDPQGSGMALRRKSVFDDEDSNIKRVELRIGGMTVSLSLTRSTDVHRSLSFRPSVEPVSHLSNPCSRVSRGLLPYKCPCWQNVALYNTTKGLRIQHGHRRRLRKKLRIVVSKRK